jgi:hypothetical protein
VTTSHVRQQAVAARTRGRRVAAPRTTDTSDQTLFSEAPTSRFPSPASMPRQPRLGAIMHDTHPATPAEWDALDWDSIGHAATERPLPERES